MPRSRMCAVIFPLPDKPVAQRAMTLPAGARCDASFTVLRVQNRSLKIAGSKGATATVWAELLAPSTVIIGCAESSNLTGRAGHLSKAKVLTLKVWMIVTDGKSRFLKLISQVN